MSKLWVHKCDRLVKTLGTEERSHLLLTMPMLTLISREIAYSTQKDQEQALEDYDKAISITPDNADVYYALGFTIALKEGRKQEAIEAYQKAADLYQQQNKPKYSQNALKKIEELSASESP